MKHNYTLLDLLVAVALLFAVGCSKSDKDEVLLSQTQTETATEGEKNYLYATIEDEESRTFVVDNRIICWHAGDMISAFCNTTYNSKYTFLGEDGDKGGMFTGTQSGSGNVLDYFYAIYPYNTKVTMKVDGKITTTLPYLQSYAKDSFGKGANPMVAVATNSAQKLMFNNICGYLKIKLYGNNVKIKSLVLQGNNGEKLSGAATISAPYGEKPAITMAADATEAVAISCVNGVTLGTTSEDATTFWFALPPTTFQNGITITAYTTDGLGFTQSTSNKVTITRNRIQPMGAVEVKDLKASVPSNEIWYTSSNGKIVTPYKTNVFGATILSNTYEDGLGVITFDRPITSIGDDAFYNCTSLTSITIPDSVTEIRDKAFQYCSLLKSVTIGDSVTSIGWYAFYSCTSLTSVTIPDSVTSIGTDAFSYCTSLTSVTIPNSVTSIGERAFCNCRSLTSVTIGNSVTSIGEKAFYNCTGELTVNCNIPSASSYEYGAFYGSKFTKVTIGDSVTSIGDNAFYNCTSLKSVTIPNSVTEIGNSAFEYCTSLTSITIPNSVSSIGNSAFGGCTSLKAFYGKFASSDNCCLIVDGELLSFAIGCGATEYTIPDSVTSIGDYAFCDCTSLTSVTIPDSVTSIGNSTFEGCNALASVTIPNSVTSIGESAFYDCSSLTSVYITDLSAWCKISFDNRASNPLYYGAKLYLNGSELTDITIPSDITEIKAYAFYRCTSLTSVTIPDSVTSIGSRAFAACTSLIRVTIPDSVTSIGESAFNSCDSLTSITIPNSVTSIGEYAFAWCENLTSVTIGNGVTSIGGAAFYNCTSLKSVYCKPTTPPAGGKNMFMYSNNGSSYYYYIDCKIYVPAGTESKYKSASYWSSYSSSIYGVIFTDENEPVN